MIYRRDFPALKLPSGSRVFLLESVLATIEVKSELNKNTLFEALDNCASLSDLDPNVVAGVLDEIAKNERMTKTPKGEYTHPDPIHNARFTLIGRPPTFIFGFRGYKKNSEELAKALCSWIDYRNSKKLRVAMRYLPAVIAAEGCFSWRNANPYQWPENVLCGVGRDSAPLRLVILQLLYSLVRRIPIAPDSRGLTPNLDVYLSQMAPPSIDRWVGQATNLV